MTDVPASHLDLLDAPLATFATNGPDGRAQLSAVWFLYADGGFHLSVHAGRQKTKNVVRDPRATLFILDPHNPVRYVEVRGDVEVSGDDDYVFADALCAKYGGTVDLRDVDGADRRRVKVTLVPAHVVAVDLSARPA